MTKFLLKSNGLIVVRGRNFKYIPITDAFKVTNGIAPS